MMLQVKLLKNKETKNTVRYDCPDDIVATAAISTLYIGKKDLPSPPPATVTVTVEYEL